jgi:hypothetical protein
MVHVAAILFHHVLASVYHGTRKQTYGPADRYEFSVTAPAELLPILLLHLPKAYLGLQEPSHDRPLSLRPYRVLCTCPASEEHLFL